MSTEENAVPLNSDPSLSLGTYSGTSTILDGYRINWKLTGLVFAATTVGLFTLPPLMVFTMIEVMIFALFGSALNLWLSYAGILSFGHSVYFGLGAYGLAITIARFDWPMGLGILAGPLVSAVFALVFGILCVQLTTVYMAMLTLACAEVTYAIAFQWFDFTGGDSGISGHVPAMLDLGPRWFGLVVLVVVTACVLLLWRVVHSPLGLTIRSVGLNPGRAAAMGHGRKRIQLISFVIMGFMSGVAGTLFGMFHGNVFPDYVGVLYTIDGLVMILLGGLHHFAAGIYGAIVYKVLDNLIAHYFEYWQFIIGVILLGVILFSPTGIAGIVERIFNRTRERSDG